MSKVLLLVGLKSARLVSKSVKSTLRWASTGLSSEKHVLITTKWVLHKRWHFQVRELVREFHGRVDSVGWLWVDYIGMDNAPPFQKYNDCPRSLMAVSVQKESFGVASPAACAPKNGDHGWIFCQVKRHPEDASERQVSSLDFNGSSLVAWHWNRRSAYSKRRAVAKRIENGPRDWTFLDHRAQFVAFSTCRILNKEDRRVFRDQLKVSRSFE
jgi:hypothetical protein